jgi:uncharacterized integral membrane protein
MNTTSADTRARERGGTRHNKRDQKQIAAWVILVLAAAWLIAFIVANSEQVKVSFVFGDVTLSLIWVMIICAVVGALLVVLIPRIRRRQ